VKIEHRQKELRIIFPIVGFGIRFAVGMYPATTVRMLNMITIQLFILSHYRAVFFIRDKLIVKHLF
jgi:hypothetical protein